MMSSGETSAEIAAPLAARVLELDHPTVEQRQAVAKALTALADRADAWKTAADALTVENARLIGLLARCRPRRRLW